MNTLILENDRSKARTPRMSACKPVVCDSSVEDRTKPLGMFRTEIRRFTRGRGEARRSEEKQEKALALSVRQGKDFCPQCGQLRGHGLTLF